MTFRKKVPSLLIYITTILVLIILIIFIDPQNLVLSLLNLGIWAILGLVLLYIIDLTVRVYRWKLLLQVQGVNLPVQTLIMPVVSALAINLFTIARAGEAVRVFALKRNYEVRYSDTISSIVIEQVLSIIGLLFVITGSLFFVGGSLQIVENSILIQQLIFLLFLVSVVCLLGLWFAIINPEFIEKILTFFPLFIEKRLVSVYRSFQEGIKDLKSSPSILSLGIITSASIWIIEGVMLYVIATSLFSSYSIIDLPWLIAASCAGNITFIIPILPGAMGQYEIIIGIILFSAQGYPGEGSLLIALIDRVTKSVILGIIGGYATLSLGGTEILRLREDFFTVSKVKNSNKNVDKKYEQSVLKLDTSNSIKEENNQKEV
ncbi:MAG: YbhN family protein [Candidatus Hodarchaeota archaeon]